MVVFNRRRIKSIDCKLMGVLIEDALRAKTVEQLNDDNFIFIRRAVDYLFFSLFVVRRKIKLLRYLAR